ncbi:hypothetical protein PMAYCL1PPCAC_32501, partial [Pristionchus mayeri]
LEIRKQADDFAKFEASRVSNVILIEWMPQHDLLADSRVDLFVSHGGMAFCQEIAHARVPALLIPIFGDQINNAAALAHVGIAQVFSKFDMIDSDKVRKAIEEMLGNSSYKLNALRIHDQLAARPTSP